MNTKYSVRLFYLSLIVTLLLSSNSSIAHDYPQSEVLNITIEASKEDSLEHLIKLSEAYWKTDKNKSDSIIKLAFNFISSKNTFDEKLLGDAYHILGKVLINKKQYKAGIDSLKIALVHKHKVSRQNYTSNAITLNYIGLGFMDKKDFDSSIYYYNLATQVLYDNDLTNINLYNALLNIGINYSKLGKVYYALNYFDTAFIALNNSEHANDSIIVAFFYYNYALSKTLTGKLKDANKYFVKAETILRNKFGESNINLAGINNNKGINSYYDYDLSKAILYYKKALDIYKANSASKDKITRIYYNLSQVSQDAKDFSSSINFCLTGLNHNPGNDFKLILNQNIAVSYAEMENSEKANTYFKIALNLLNEENINPKREMELYFSYAYFLLKTKNELSLLYLKKALKLAALLKGKDLSKFAEILSEIGSYFLKVEKIADSAMYYYNSSIIVFDNIGNETEVANINIILREKAKVGYAAALLLKFYETGEIDKLYKADTIFANGLDAMNAVSNSLAYGNKLLLIEIADPVYDLAIENSNEILKLTCKTEYADKIFNYTERSKSSALLSAVNTENALRTSDIPDELFNYEHKLKDEINGLQQLLENEKAEEYPKETNISFFESKLLHLINTYDSLIVSIESDYPIYYSLKYRTKVISPLQVKKKLEHNEAIVEYNLTDSTLYILTITTDDFIINSIRIDSNFYNSLDYIISIKNIDFSQQNSEKFNEFKYHSNNLWKTLIKPISSTIKNKRLIIIPDGKLGYLPFDLLIVNNPDYYSINYRDLPYLLRDHALSYSYSATLKYNTYFNTIREVPTNNILAFAPLYTGSSTDNNLKLTPLPFAKKEAIDIVKSRGGNVFIDKEATKENFLKYAGSSNILHLAMHTIINDSLPMLSKLIFYNDGKNTTSNFMFTHELYNMNLNATMVVLSACNTGAGDLKKGEGIMSLARGFVYAGIPSIVMTLWEVQDASGSLIMNKYYDNLNLGKPKDVALQQAKLSVLANANMAKSHPFFWSTYILNGNTSSMGIVNKEKNSGGVNYYLIIAILGFLAVILVYISRQKNP